ncbi:coiled-coil domain-containing protein [Candidatus Fokinia solitaria]|nr:hypothetical protein [Candidatus Fokinia solitaria]
MNNTKSTLSNESTQKSDLFQSAIELAESTDKLISQYQNAIRGLEDDTLTHEVVEKLSNSKEVFEQKAEKLSERTKNAIEKRNKLRAELRESQRGMERAILKNRRQAFEMQEEQNDIANSDENIAKTMNSLEERRRDWSKGVKTRERTGDLKEHLYMNAKTDLGNVDEDLILLHEINSILHDKKRMNEILSPKLSQQELALASDAREEARKNRVKKELTEKQKEQLQKNRGIRAAAYNDGKALGEKVGLLHMLEENANEKIRKNGEILNEKVDQKAKIRQDDVIKSLNTAVDELIGKETKSSALGKNTLINALNSIKEKLKHFVKKVHTVLDDIRKNRAHIVRKKLSEIRRGLEDMGEIMYNTSSTRIEPVDRKPFIRK